MGMNSSPSRCKRVKLVANMATPTDTPPHSSSPHKSPHRRGAHNRSLSRRQQALLLPAAKYIDTAHDYSDQLDQGRLRHHPDEARSTQDPAVLSLVHCGNGKPGPDTRNHLHLHPGLRRSEGEVSACEQCLLGSSYAADAWRGNNS